MFCRNSTGSDLVWNRDRNASLNIMSIYPTPRGVPDEEVKHGYYNVLVRWSIALWASIRTSKAAYAVEFLTRHRLKFIVTRNLLFSYYEILADHNVLCITVWIMPTHNHEVYVGLCRILSQ